MTTRQLDPSRRCLTPQDWPTEDQRRWSNACQKGGVLDDGGMAAHWAPATCVGVAKAYGRFINFLESTAQLHSACPPAERITPDRIAAFVHLLESQVSPVSVWSLVSHLCMGVKVMFPEPDWQWLQQVVNRLHQRASIAKRDIRVLPARKLWKAGIKLMDQAHMAHSLPLLLKASRYRDGLMLALQSARPLRLKNLAALDVERHLKRVGDTYSLVFDGSEMKNRSPFEISVPAALTPRMDRYLAIYRPALAKGSRSSALWITKQGRAMRPFSVHQRISRITRRLFGSSMSVHRFRHASATAIAIERPEKVRMAMSLLGHRQFSTTDRYYIAGQSLEASRSHNSLIDGLRRKQTTTGEDR